MINEDYRTVQRIVQARRTAKFLAPPGRPAQWPADRLARIVRTVDQALRDSGQAPFHYARNAQGIAEPWRMYRIDHGSCCRMAADLPRLVPDLKPGNKLAGLLAGCACLCLFNWLPEPPDPDGSRDEKRQRVNREHLAATAAAVQNFLLLCTAAELPTYWASGTLIQKHLFPGLGIGGGKADEELLAAVFVHGPGAGSGNSHVQQVGGKQRDKRDPECRWLQTAGYAGPATANEAAG